MADHNDPERRSHESHHARRARQENSHRPFSHAAEEREQHRKRKALKNHLIAMSGEFIGTILFLWFAFAGTQVAAMVSTTPNGGIDSATMDPQRLMYIALSFGMSLLVVVWAFYRISGGLFNPAVTLGLCMSGAVPWLRGLCLLPVQILGGIVAAALVSCMFPGPLSLFQTRLSAGTSVAQGVFIEMFLTALLVFVILMLAAEKHYATFMAPIPIGVALFVAELAGQSTQCFICEVPCRFC